MRDHPEIIREFVKIVQRYPEVYDTRVDSYRMRGNQIKAWLRIKNSVKNELREECTSAELKLKWKGIRSSFNRYLGKLQNSMHCKKYYLYDTLSFLIPFVHPKSIPQTSTHPEFRTENESSVDWSEFNEVDIKPDTNQQESSNTHQEMFIGEENENTNNFEEETETYMPSAAKRKCVDKDDEESVSGSAEEGADLMNFFRSIIPDLKDFTLKEKRKFKISVLGLIDVIEEQRQQENNKINSS